MSILDQIMWFTGVATWGLLGIFGLVWGIDQAIEWIVDSYGLKREFFEFVWQRRKRKRPTPSPTAGESR